MSFWDQLSDDPNEANLAFVYGGTCYAAVRIAHTPAHVEEAVCQTMAKAADPGYATWSFAALSERGFRDWRWALVDHAAFAAAATALLRQRLREVNDPRADGPEEGPNFLDEPIRPRRWVWSSKPGDPHYGKEWGPGYFEWV